jgi:hypothetical protein
MLEVTEGTLRNAARVASDGTHVWKGQNKFLLIRKSVEQDKWHFNTVNY